MPLLAPKLIGPLSPLSTSVRIEHVLPGAVGEILVNGGSVGQTATANGNDLDVLLAGVSLKARDVITAVWSIGGETSPPSLPEQVLDYPKALPAPIFISSIHTGTDWVAITGLYPGATVEIYDSNFNVIGGPETAESSALHVSLPGVISSGDRLLAVQTVQVPGAGPILSPKGHSLQAERLLTRGEIPPQPVIIMPIHECAGAVLIGGAVPGCYVEIDFGAGVLEYPAINETFWAILPKPAHAPDTYVATVVLKRFHSRSIPSAPIGVDPSKELDIPRLDPDHQHCPLTVSLSASHLSPGTELSFGMHGSAGVTNLGRAGAPSDSTTENYYLGDLSPLVPGVPPNPHIVLTEKACARIVDSNDAYVSPPSGIQEVPPGFFAPPVACSWWLNVLNVNGCLISVHSDNSDWPILAYWKQADTNGWILLNRALQAGEHLWVTIERGCVSENLRVSDKVRVEEHGGLNSLHLEEPVRPGHNRSVGVHGVIPGARVHLFVNDIHRTSVWAVQSVTSPLLEIYVGNVVERNRLKVCQEMCGEIGETAPAVYARTGQMALDISPKSVDRGQSVAVTIRAKDADTGTILAYSGGSSPIFGPSGFVGYTNHPFTVIAGAGTPTPIHFTVNQEGYDSGSVDLQVQEPTPPQLGALTIKSMSAIGVQQQIIQDIEWTLIGAGQKFVGSQKPNTTSTSMSIELPTPVGGGHVEYSLSGKATIEFIQPNTLQKITQSVTVFSTAYGFLGSIVIQNWTGSPLSIEVNIGWTAIYNPQTGAVVGEVYYFILDKGPS